MLCLNSPWMSKKPNDADEIIKNIHVEGAWHSMITPADKNRPDWEAFSTYFLMFAKHHNLTPTLAPFVKRTHSLEWFTRKLSSTSDQEVEANKIWEAFLTPNLISTRLGTSKENVKILCYQPNLVSCQFGVSQTMPKPFFNQKNELCLYTVD